MTRYQFLFNMSALIFTFPNKMPSCHDSEIGSRNSANVSSPIGTHTVCELLFGESVPTSQSSPAVLASLESDYRSRFSLVIAGTIQNRRHCTQTLDKLDSWSGRGRSAVGILRTKLSPDFGIDKRYKRLFLLRGQQV